MIFSETQSPPTDLVFINEKGSKFMKQKQSVRVVSLLSSSSAHLHLNTTASIDAIAPNTTGVCHCTSEHSIALNSCCTAITNASVYMWICYHNQLKISKNVHQK